MNAREKEDLLTAATLALFQRVKNASHIFDILGRAREVARSSSDYDEDWEALVKAIDSAMCKVPIEARIFAQSVLEVNPDDWDFFTGLDYDRLVDKERQSRGLPAFDFDSHDTIPYEHPAGIIRRLKGLNRCLKEVEATDGDGKVTHGQCPLIEGHDSACGMFVIAEVPE